MNYYELLSNTYAPINQYKESFGITKTYYGLQWINQNYNGISKNYYEVLKITNN